MPGRPNKADVWLSVAVLMSYEHMGTAVVVRPHCLCPHTSACQTSGPCLALVPSSSSSAVMSVAVNRALLDTDFPLTAAEAAVPCTLPEGSADGVHAQECVQNCKCTPMHIDALWGFRMSIKVLPFTLTA